jgi:hypothetical protein
MRSREAVSEPRPLADRSEVPTSSTHTTDNAGFQTYTPPTSGRGSDWILVLESEAAGFPLPGLSEDRTPAQ